MTKCLTMQRQWSAIYSVYTGCSKIKVANSMGLRKKKETDRCRDTYKQKVLGKISFGSTKSLLLPAIRIFY